LSPVFTQEFVPDTQSQLSPFAPLQSTQGTIEAGRVVRASFTALGLALSLGATGSLISSAEAADSMQLAALPSVTGAPGTLPSFGSAGPEGAPAVYHTVADGETIWDIANRHGVTVEDIKAANGIGEAQVIQAGQVLKVPSVVTHSPVAAPTVLEIPQKTIESSSDLTGVETQADDVETATILDGSQVLAPSGVSELLATRALVTDSKAIQEDVDVAATVPTVVMGAPEPDEAATIALLPESDPVQSFAAQLESPAKSAAKAQSADTEADTAVRVFRDEQMTHRVGSGETVWSIARRYGIAADTLQAANEIENPNFIVAGDELVIPNADASAVVDADDIERLSRRQTTVEHRMAAIAPMIEKVEDSPASTEAATTRREAETLAVGLEPQAFEMKPTETAIADPFVEGLLSDVAAATQSQAHAAATAAERYSQELAAASDKAIVGESSDEIAAAHEVAATVRAIATTVEESSDAVAINPQFADEVEADVTDIETSAFPEEELLAVAPLGSEVYAPVIENPAGRIVSPATPVLPGKEEYLPEAPNRFEGYMWPAQGTLTSGYGWRWGRMHQGVDIAGPVGTPIYAAAPGVVVKSGWNSGGYGNLVDIRHPDGSMTRYAHNSRLLVSEGQEVRQGQQIAEMGSTGYSTGPHLHFEIHVPNQGTVNPIALLPGR
jgi:murein DD-endopeptidase MepM/ murein hydrolase activator NlpD